MRAAIFDLDGTLVDSAPDIQANANALLASLGYQSLSIETIRRFIGNGVPKLVERVMREVGIAYSDARHAELTAKFETLYGLAPVEHTILYPGVKNALTDLRAHGVIMGICTNKVRTITQQVLEGLQIDGYFDVVIGGDSLPVRKPDPAPLIACIKTLGAEEVVFVGDSEVDSATSLAAKVPFALHTGGYRNGPVSGIPHNSAFSDFAELGNIVMADVTPR